MLSTSGCMQEEGCLDAEASNFSVSADKDCAAECCEYPKLDIRFFALAGGGGFSTNTFYLDAAGTPFRIENIRFFISDVQLLRADGTQVGVKDTVTLQPAETRVEDNYALTQLNTFSYEIGDIAGYGDFVGVRFNVGLDSTANAVEPELMPEGHPLGIQQDTMYVDSEEGYAFSKIDIAVAVADTTTQTYNITGNDNLATVSLTNTFSFLKTFGTEVQLNVDYLQLFDTVDFLNDDENIIIQKIVNNTPAAFSIP